MKSLTDLLNEKNQWNRLVKVELYEVDTAEGRQRVAEMIDSDLSPENLTCDGMLPRTEVNRRYNQLVNAARALKSLDPSITFIEFTE